MPNLPWAMLRPSLCVVAWTLPLLVELAAPDAASRADGLATTSRPALPRSDSASRQATRRVDNCKVPLDRRGPKPRPDGCADGASTRNHK